LANATDVKVLELSLGSSDWRRTGAYKEGSVIVQSKADCAPCPHSSPCSQASHRCSEMLSPHDIALVAMAVIEGDVGRLKRIAVKRCASLQILRAHILKNGCWTAIDTAAEGKDIVSQAIERCVWKFVLDGEDLNPLARFGTESLNLSEDLKHMISSDAWAGVLPHLDFIESHSQRSHDEAGALLNQALVFTKPGGGELEPALNRIREFFGRHRPYARALSWLDEVAGIRGSQTVIPITGLRRLQSEIDEIARQSEAKTKLVRSLKSQLTEFL
jgi:hypothetical protein